MSRKKVGEPIAAGERPPEVLELLNKSPEARKEFYQAYWADHRNIIDVANELLRLILEPADAEVIYLIGATGVGKTTAAKYAISKLEEMALPIIDNFPGRIPAAYIETESPDMGAYDWGEHYINTLLALDEVLIDKKVYLPGPRDGIEALRKKEGPRRAALRRAAENALRNRIMYAFFVDEAQFITKRKSGVGLMDQADTIRSLAARSKTLHVLSGTYDLRHLRNLNGQLGRRSHTVLFRPYRLNEGLTQDEQVREVEAFTQAFFSLQAYLPVDEQPNLGRHIEFCFMRCVGCVGHLKSWFRRSLSMALEDNCKTITSELFLKAAPKKEVWERIAQEIAEGEEALDERDDELENEFRKLGHANNPPAEPSGNNDAGAGGKAKTGARSKRSSSKSRKGGRPFTPNPERYPVGINEKVG